MDTEPISDQDLVKAYQECRHLEQQILSIERDINETELEQKNYCIDSDRRIKMLFSEIQTTKLEQRRRHSTQIAKRIGHEQMLEEIKRKIKL